MGCGKECLEEGGCGYRCLQVIRWLPVVFVTAILGWAWYAYVIQLCFNTVSNDFQRAFYLIFFHTFLFLFIWSYLATVFAKLRRPPAAFFLPPDVLTEISEVRDDDRLIAAVLHRYASREKLPIRMRSYEGAGQYLRYCAKCRCLKPDRSHHCSMCGQCILKFDHHCPWVNTCVSFHNYKYFILFLGYGVALCLFGCLSDLPYFVLFWKNDMHERSDVIIGKFHMLFLFFVSGMFSLSLGGLFFYHLYLTARNRTTIEAFRPPMMSNGEDKHAFNMGIRANFRQVFGTRPLLWFLPVYSSEGDGFAMDCSTCQTVPVDESPPDFASPFGGRDETDRTDARHDIGDASSDGHICGANGMPIRPTSYRVLLSDVEDEEQQSAQFGTPPLSHHTTSTTASPPLSSGNKDNGQQSRNDRTYYSHGAVTA